MILDGHIHLGREPCDRAALGARMAEAGVDGGVLLSLPPGSMGDVIGTASVAERLDDLFAWCACAPNLLRRTCIHFSGSIQQRRTPGHRSRWRRRAA